MREPIVKIFFLLILWTSVVIIIFFKYKNDSNKPDCAVANWNIEKLLRQSNKEYPEAISITSDILDQYELLVDKRPALTEEQLLVDIEKHNPSLPIAYWNRRRMKFAKDTNVTCAKYPSIFDLHYNNLYWQTLYTSNGTFQLYGAYYDKRHNSPVGPTVRLLGMVNRVDIRLKTYCQLWFDKFEEAVISEIYEYNFIWYKDWGNYVNGKFQPYLMSCKIPERYLGFVPSAVSLVEHKCDTATNNLRVIYNRPPDDRKKRFAVCLKGLNFFHDDLSARLVEWFEMMQILGAEKIYLYKLHVHPNISKVLDHYVRADKLEYMPLTLPDWIPNTPGYQHMFFKQTAFIEFQNELIPYNDCIYKNIYRYDYIAVLDIDEVIMPKNGADNWNEMLQNLERLSDQKQDYHSFQFLHIYFMDIQQEKFGYVENIPKYMHLLQHVHRSKNHTRQGYFVKSIHNTEHVLTVTNHLAMSCITKWCNTLSVDPKYGQLQHYRHDCNGHNGYCDAYIESTEDFSILRFKDELLNRTKQTLATIGFFGKKKIAV